jgi:hypothetical protein
MNATASKTTDLRGLWAAARRGQRFLGDSNKWFRHPYTPAGSARLHLAQAVSTGYKQEAYADYATYEIPFSGEISEESTKRLNAFFWAASTATGFAGEGATWSLDAIDAERKVVRCTCRASICD